MRRAALLAVPFVVAACGGSGGGGSSAQTTTTTTQTSSANPTAAVNRAIAKGAKVPVHAEFSGVVTASGQHVRMSGSGDVDTRSRLGSLHLSLSLAGQQVPVDEVLHGETVYASSAFFRSFLPSGKKWLEIDLSSASNLGAAGFALASQPGAVPPLEDARQLGTSTIDGMQTTEYSAKVDRTRLPPAAKAALRSTHVRFGAVEVWVGADGYVHRVRIATSSSAGGAKATAVLTTTMSKYGEKVHVTIPPASQTVKANNLNIPGFSS